MTGIRAQILHILPARHALFQVRVTISQLASVPLVHGEFGVRWKFKNTHKVKGKDKATGKLAETEHEHEHDGDGDSFGSAETSAEEPHASSSSVLPTEDAQTSVSARGQTQWLPLREHSVTWEHPLATVVQMSIERDTHRLLPHHLKLTVMQRVIAHDPDAPHNPRLGVVELDLAEYADSVPLPPGGQSKGVVTRRYLLRDSKTNATLRLSIRVDPVNTSVLYIAPPLPNGEILAGVATLLTTHDDVYRTRPRALDLYAPVDSPPSSSSKSSFKSKASSVPEQSFDLRVLPRAYGPRPTESLIEALFNPAPVREEHLLSPFTKLVRADSSSISFTPSTTSSSSRPSTSTSSGGLAPSSRVSGHRHSPSLTPSISPSVGSTQTTTSSDGRPHHWWQRPGTVAA
ncbi:N-terminal C2 in EEIG1 and EHBP1 proteins-domain-containing protein [Mycena amicta]|nr:N-terminal C2 in EEIG1 and EHBP1 proteins-domain-containing protein [Mycena amicta]